jgi:hypothetical protein
MHVPEDIGRDRVQSHSSRLLKSISPVFSWDALVVQFTGDDLPRLAVEREVIAFDAKVMTCA